MEFDFNDLEVDEVQQYNLKINQLQHQLQQMTARLSFPAFVQTGVAGYKIAEHYIGRGLPAMIGGLAGAYFFKNKKLSDMDREIMLKKVNLIRKQISELKKQRDAGISASEGIMSASQLANYDYPKYDFDGKWEAFFGNPSINCHYMIYGLPKSGKSTFSMHFAKYLADHQGRVLYVASEEGFSQTLQNKVNTFKLNSDNLAFSNARDFEPIRNLAPNFDFVVIDSVNYIKITPEQVEELKAENPNVSLITIQQATKDGDYKGDTAYAHNADSIVRIENGIAFQQGRFQEAAEMMVFPPKKKEKGLIQYEESQEQTDEEYDEYEE